MIESPSIRDYEVFRDSARAALDQGRLEQALADYQTSLSVAENLGEEILVDRALCNVAAVEIELRQFADEKLNLLREILMRNADEENCRLAAYNLSYAYALKKSYKKALFYARISLDRSKNLDRSAWIASSRNSIGNILLAESYFKEARAEYEQALALSQPGRSLERALILDNLGYCNVIESRFPEGFAQLYESLRTLRALGARGFERYPLLSLCFASLEVGRNHSAARFGARAHEIAESVGDDTIVKNSLYLLGEAANLAGDARSARRYFERLQTRFFPQDGFLPDFLLAIDVRKIVNLRA